MKNRGGGLGEGKTMKNGIICVLLGMLLAAGWALYERPPRRQVPLADPMDQVVSIDLESKPLREAIEAIARAGGAAVQGSWETVDEPLPDGMRRDVTLHVRNVTMRAAIEMALRRVGASARVEWSDGVVWVLGSEEIPKVVTRVIDVADLLNDEREPAAFWGDPHDVGLTPRQARAGMLVDLVRENVDRESWTDNGGKFGSISLWSDRLVVSTTPSNMDAIEALLDQLHRPERRLRHTVLQETIVARSPLEARIGIVEMEQRPLSEVFGRLGEIAGVNLDVRWDGMEDFAVGWDTRVSVRIRDASLRQALEQVIRIADPRLRLDCWWDGQVLTLARAGSHPLLRVQTYEISDVFGSSASDPEATQLLIDLVLEAVDRESWINSGGQTGWIGGWGTLLIVQQSEDNHARIAALLDQIRRSRGSSASPATRP